jgi:hypothetical protein
MARGSNGVDGLELFFMKVKGLKHGEKVHIEQTKPLGDKQYVTLEETIDRIGGSFHELKFRTYTHQGDNITEVQIWLKDPKAGAKGEMYAISLNMNSVARSILNALLSIDGPIGNLELRFYNKKDNGYANVYIEHNGAKIGWKYKQDEVSHLIVSNTVSKKGQTVVEKDYFKLDEYFIKEATDVIVPKGRQSAPRATAEASNAPQVEEPYNEASSDDLPF